MTRDVPGRGVDLGQEHPLRAAREVVDVQPGTVGAPSRVRCGARKGELVRGGRHLDSVVGDRLQGRTAAGSRSGFLQLHDVNGRQRDHGITRERVRLGEVTGTLWGV